MDFYKQLNYSIGNEDWRVEEQALRVSPGDKVVCITASGDRPLHLLMTGCEQTVSIDRNHVQNYLLELKRAAIAKLDFDKYMEFLGLAPCQNRYAILKQELLSDLSPEAAAFWLKNKKMINKGIIYQGRTERLTNLGAKFIQLFRNRSNQQLLAFDDLEQQRQYVHDKWDTYMWRKFFEVTSNPNFFRYIFNDPGMISFADYSRKPGKYIYDRMLRYLETDLARNSPLLQLILTGRILPEAYFQYLTEEGFNKIRANLNKLDIKTVNVIDYFKETPANTFNCYSLSDIASHMPQEVFDELVKGVYSSAKDNAHFCFREFISGRMIPKELENNFQRDRDLEKKLDLAETNFIYRFMVGNIKKSH